MPFGLRLWPYTAMSVAAIAGAVAYAAATHKNYYSAMVFLWSSKSVALVRETKKKMSIFANFFFFFFFFS
jgi:hypothetical protein